MKSSEQFHDNNTINTWRESDSHEGKSVFRNQRQRCNVCLVSCLKDTYCK